MLSRVKKAEQATVEEGGRDYRRRQLQHGVAIDVDDAVEHGKDLVLDVDSMVNFMEKKLASTRGKPKDISNYPSWSTIFRVPEDIRNIDAAAYSPKVVSIGLLQQEKRRLDEHKWHYLDKVLSRRKNNLRTYTKEIANIVVEAGFCYSGCPKPGGMYWRFKDYAEIMLVDGCFIINLFLKLEDKGLVEINDPIYSNKWTLPWVAHDMLLLENQLPFFVLEKLWELTGRERHTLKTKVFQFFCNLLPEELSEHDLKLPETGHVHHLLHLIHLSLQPASSSEKTESTSGTTKPGDTRSSTENNSSESPESLPPTSPAMTSQPVISSTSNSSFESPKPLQPASPTEKPESANGATIPSPPHPSDTPSTSKSSPFKSTESLQPTSPAGIFPSALLPHDEFPIYKESALLPHDEFPILTESVLESFPTISSALLPHDEFPYPSGVEISALLPQSEFSITSGPERSPKALKLVKQMSEPAPLPKTIPSATELQEAGVKFQKKKARSFLDVTFEQGKMKMPRLTISDSTNSLFRNFIAFEQGYPDCGSHFTSYCSFMDSLINTPRDVEILKQAGIIEHVLGSDKEVAFLFNKLCKGITWDFNSSYLAKVFKDVTQHCEERWPKWRAKLVRDYFSNPWAILSLAAAIVMLILTFLQAFFGVFAYFRPP